jgi:hypothetical protein
MQANAAFPSFHSIISTIPYLIYQFYNLVVKRDVLLYFDRCLMIYATSVKLLQERELMTGN